MTKQKSRFVTGLLAAMLALIVAGLYKLLIVGFWVVVGALALYGFARCTVDFCTWLRRDERPKEAPLEPVFGEPADESFASTYDQIREELRRDAV